MNQSAIGWIALAIAAFVYLDLLFVELRRVVHEGRRIVTRLLAYADAPVIEKLERAGEDAERISRALEAVDPLLERGRIAIGVIRRGGRPERYDPLVPNGSDASNGFSID